MIEVEYFGMGKIYDMPDERQVSIYGYILTALNRLNGLRSFGLNLK